MRPPGALNMVTGAAPASVNRIPVLLLPGDVFACRQPDPVLQQVEDPTARQPLEGVLFSREELGTRPFTLLAPDTFGQTGNLPQLALSAGGRALLSSPRKSRPGRALAR